MVPSIADGDHCHHKRQKYETANPADHDSMLHRVRFLDQDEWGQRHLWSERATESCSRHSRVSPPAQAKLVARALFQKLP